jgi:hypothetical protein
MGHIKLSWVTHFGHILPKIGHSYPKTVHRSLNLATSHQIWSWPFNLVISTRNWSCATQTWEHNLVKSGQKLAIDTQNWSWSPKIQKMNIFMTERIMAHGLKMAEIKHFEVSFVLPTLTSESNFPTQKTHKCKKK